MLERQKSFVKSLSPLFSTVTRYPSALKSASLTLQCEGNSLMPVDGSARVTSLQQANLLRLLRRGSVSKAGMPSSRVLGGLQTASTTNMEHLLAHKDPCGICTPLSEANGSITCLCPDIFLRLLNLQGCARNGIKDEGSVRPASKLATNQLAEAFKALLPNQRS